MTHFSTNMASLLLFRRPMLTGIVCASSVFAASQLLQPQRHRFRLDASPSPIESYTHTARNPVITSDHKVNPRIFRQVSTGSIVGFLGGFAISLFSKSLTVLIGLLVFGVQALESRGIHIVPWGMLRRYYSETNLRSAILDNVAFKLAFGASFALAGFAKFE